MTSEPKTPHPEADQLAEEELDAVSGGMSIGSGGASTIGSSSVKTGSGQSSSLGQQGSSSSGSSIKPAIQRS